MASTELVVQAPAYSRANLTERQQYVASLARAGDLLPAHLRGKMVRDQNGQMSLAGDVGKTFLLAETGDMLGIHPMAAITGVHIIEGKPSISANLMSALVRKAGHKLRIKVTGSADDETLAATAQLIRSDDEDFTFEVTWNVAKAKRAGLWPGKDSSNWRKYPDAMMKARAVSEVIREGAPDVLTGGNVFTPEELGAQVTEEGNPIDLQQVPSHGETERDAANYTSDGDATPDAPREPRKETPIPDDPKPEEGPEVVQIDWARDIANLSSYQGALELHAKARQLGLLDAEFKQGRKKRQVGDAIVEVGKALREAEEAAAAEADNVVDAEIVHDEEPPMAMGGEQ